MKHLDSYSRNMIVHDNRLEGNPPLGYAANIYHVDDTTSTAHIFDWVATHASRIGGISRLYIMCHGYAGGNDFEMVSADVGGLGLQLGRDSLTLGNVRVVAPLRNRVQRIIIYACAAADNSMARYSPAADGHRLMGELAYYSGAYVVAADRIQWYSRVTVSGSFSYIGGRGDTNMIDFGAWEGTVYEFPPDAGAPRQLRI
ncbi:hypothetical protein [Larkinella soli]|uniref:hypothetical protein n=1 Tax=Larkinella soli TaxID=1770527 RepID=UPI000FFBB36D|nr:hypothetical protein [Larkinella soli]